ncbi:hypothetical protein Alg130_06476 [Pyrenophora tritici-repentis]|uniref:Atrophin-1 multi-domain protein n=1 Tax=Pyrenophora tritici-repentis TaxID=45151 RepID=A0A2W1HLA2_9PLEO|nr:hypothetical protein A1F99_118080 [Pyrenophora tritici-repentis]KAF7566543.1 Atrophin-1 multi-domain protein [Pyrenophora tritici-repentis]KAI0581281.1 hypothetical protein Alg215_04785 [Pyrenophora tritici-repentis]KAI0581647.1 hypothetical protein Alg130_06476 [Pyrenophora tritici-repentis]KAI0609336.1 hypothetical protein TUN205_06407 [Pyrenophora tritici-repentis]
MVCNDINLPSGPNVSWTDMLPPNQKPSSRRPARARYGRPVPQATPRTVARIQTIRSTLPYIKITLETRFQLQQIVLNNGSYCLHCTPRGVTGHCDPTCPLLRPTDKEFVSYWCEYDDPWLGRIETDVAAYQKIIDDMEARGTQVCPPTVGKWECGVAKLMEGCLVTTEQEEKDGWPEIERKEYDEQLLENHAAWRFEEAWGKGPDCEIGVAPEEVAGAKRELP